MTRRIAPILLVLLGIAFATPALAQHERLVAGARYFVPEGWRPVRHDTDAVVESADGRIQYRLHAAKNEFDAVGPVDWLDRAVLDWTVEHNRSGTGQADRFDLEILGELRPAMRLGLRRGIEWSDALFVLHVDGIRHRVVSLHVASPDDLDTHVAAFSAWLDASALHEIPAVSPAPRSGALGGTFAALTRTTREEWMAAPDSTSDAYVGDDSTRAAHDWTRIDVDAYAFWREDSRLHWGVPEIPIDSLETGRWGDERQRWGRYAIEGDRMQIWFRFGNEASFPFSADSASVQIVGRTYTRLRPVQALREVVGTWRHVDVKVSEVGGGSTSTRLEEVERVTFAIRASSEVTMTRMRESIQTEANGLSRVAGPPQSADGTASVNAGIVTLTFPERAPIAVSAYWIGETLLMGGDAFERVPSAGYSD